MYKGMQLDKIIDESLLAIRNGQETIDSILDRYPKDASRLRPKLEAALWLANAGKALDPRPGFIASSRAYLEQRLKTTPPTNAWQRLITRYSPQRWVFNITTPILLIFLLVLVINSLVLTARLSIPGDPFYSTKLAIEDVQLAFTFNPEDKTDLYIQFSRERVAEFVELVLNGDYELLPPATSRMETEIIASLHSLNNLARLEPTDEMAMVIKLRETLSNEVFMLDMLRTASPSSARSEIDLAIQIAKTGELALR